MIREEEAQAEPLSSWTKWWRALQENRGDRAELRRCSTASEAAFCEAYHLLRRMRGNPTSPAELARLGLIAVALAHVDEDAGRGTSFARLLAEPRGEKTLVSDARFRQLLRTESADELLPDLVRVIHQLGRRAPVERLANDLQWWNERTRRQWALDYYEHALRQSQKQA